MYLLYAALRYYPFWALPGCWLLFELGMVFKRKARPICWLWFGISLLLLMTSVTWVVFRGDKNSNRWVREVVEWR